MTTKMTGFAVLVAAALFSSVLQAQETVSLDQIKAADTVAEFTALGARQLTADEFNERVVGHPMDEGSWTWIINADGTHSSQADDGSWTDSGGTWDFVDDGRNQYCRESPGNPRSCNSVYMLGTYLRVADTLGTLSDWTIEVQ